MCKIKQKPQPALSTDKPQIGNEFCQRVHATLDVGHEEVVANRLAKGLFFR